MKSIRKYSLLLPLLGLAWEGRSQSLEDKVSQARRLQIQSQLGMDEAALDSMYRAMRAEQARTGRSPAPAGAAVPGFAEDSLLSGPDRRALHDTLLPRSPLDSLDTVPGRKALTSGRKPLPKRYEQRIFGNVDRSVFSGAGGAVGRDYVLGPRDAVTVSLWGDREKEYDLTLNNEGKIFMEGIGLVPLAGMSLAEAQDALKSRLGKVYSGIGRGTTRVEISVAKPGPIKVFVLGEVKLPGGFVLTGNSSILTAMYFAGGPTDIGTVRNLQLNRGGKKHSIDLYKYLMHGENPSPNFLRDGDVLFAGRADALVEIEGEVGRPAVYELRSGEGVRELLEFAGRTNPSAAAHKMTLQRFFPGGKVDYVDLAQPRDYLDGKVAAPLQDGDRILVEASTETSRNFITVTGPVRYPGTYSSEGVSTIRDLMKKAGGLKEDAFLGRAHVVRFRPDGSSRLIAYSLDSAGADTVRLEPRDNVLLYSLKDMYQPDSVEVSGAVFNPGRYEFRRGMTAKDLVMQAGGFLPEHESGKLIVFSGSTRERTVQQIELQVEDGLASTSKGYPLKARDHLHVPVDPRWYTKEIVTLEGLFLRPGKYALLYPGEPIQSVVARAGGFKQNAYVEGGRFFRGKDSVGRVGVDLKRALSNPRSKANIAMAGGDSIFIPAKLNTVKVIGEVGFETSVLFEEGAGVEYYIERAGGFTRRSEKDLVVVQYANGETGKEGIFSRKPDAGSIIYVPQGPEPKRIDWIAGVNALLGTAGVAAALILSIQAIKGDR